MNLPSGEARKSAFVSSSSLLAVCAVSAGASTAGRTVNKRTETATSSPAASSEKLAVAALLPALVTPRAARTRSPLRCRSGPSAQARARVRWRLRAHAGGRDADLQGDDNGPRCARSRSHPRLLAEPETRRSRGETAARRAHRCPTGSTAGFPAIAPAPGRAACRRRRLSPACARRLR